MEEIMRQGVGFINKNLWRPSGPAVVEGVHAAWGCSWESARGEVRMQSEQGRVAGWGLAWFQQPDGRHAAYLGRSASYHNYLQTRPGRVGQGLR